MIRSLDAALIVVMIAGAAWTFQIKHKAELSADRAAQLQRQVDHEKERINLLEADWALFNSPARLQQLAERYGDDLKLVPLKSEQIATMNELPSIVLPPEPDSREAAIEPGIDPQKTGGIKPPVKKENR
jgi:hypothetical protein